MTLAPYLPQRWNHLADCPALLIFAQKLLHFSHGPTTQSLFCCIRRYSIFSHSHKISSSMFSLAPKRVSLSHHRLVVSRQRGMHYFVQCHSMNPYHILQNLLVKLSERHSLHQWLNDPLQEEEAQGINNTVKYVWLSMATHPALIAQRRHAWYDIVLRCQTLPLFRLCNTLLVS